MTGGLAGRPNSLKTVIRTVIARPALGCRSSSPSGPNPRCGPTIVEATDLPSLSTRSDPESPQIPNSPWIIRPFAIFRFNRMFSFVTPLEMRTRFPCSSKRFRSSPSSRHLAAVLLLHQAQLKTSPFRNQGRRSRHPC